DELKETNGEKDLEAHYTNAKPLGKFFPWKEKDPRSFTLPCFINNMCFNKALAELGASISVMPYSTYTTLRLGDLIPTTLVVKLADRKVKRPKGIAENVLGGRLFSSTAHAIINETIKEGARIDTPITEMVKTRHDDDMITNEIEDYLSFNNLDRKIHVNGAYNLRVSYMIVIEDMDCYRDEEMGDVIVGKYFCKEIDIKAKRIDEMTTIYNGDDE
nr:hypothetical protein [Tanacetum cinerariifolium]